MKIHKLQIAIVTNLTTGAIAILNSKFYIPWKRAKSKTSTSSKDDVTQIFVLALKIQGYQTFVASVVEGQGRTVGAGKARAREGSGARGRIGNHPHPDTHPVGNFSELAANGNQQDLQPKSKAAGRSISRELNSFQIFKGPQISSSRRGTKGKTWLATRSKVMIQRTGNYFAF